MTITVKKTDPKPAEDNRKHQALCVVGDRAFRRGSLHARQQLPRRQAIQQYDDIFNAFRDITSKFSEAECWALFHDNAERYYRL
jgi:hypothetical protein